MTAKASTNTMSKKNNPALHNWKSNIKDSRKFTIILSIMHLVSLPVTLIVYIVSIYAGNPGSDMDMYEVITVCLTCLAAFLGIFAAVDSFKCLHDKSVVDMKLALPMNNTQRFVSNFLSGLFTYLAPFLGAQVISLLLTGYGCLFMDGRTFTEMRYDSDLGREIPVPYVCDYFGEMMPVIIKLIIGGTLAMLMLYTITVLITVCCGNKFESIAYTILINVIIPATIACVLYSMFNSLYGVRAEIPAVKAIMYTSVAGGIVAAIDWAMQGEMFGGSIINYPVWLCVYTLIIIALAAASFFLYRKRRAEQVSKPFVFKLVYYIIVTGVMFCIISLFITDDGEFIPTIITTAIIYMIFEVVTNRGFKRFWLSIIKYVATFVGVTALIVIGVKTEGFGAVQRIPSASSVKSVSLGYGGFYNDFPHMAYDYYYDSNCKPLVIKEKANIETVIAAHQATIDCYNENKDKVYDYYHNSYVINDILTQENTLQITYNLKTGGSFTRSYPAYSAETAEILGRLDLTDEFKRQTAELYKKRILDSLDEFNSLVERVGEEEYAMRYSYMVNVRPELVLGHSLGRTSVSMRSLAARGFFEQLADAYYNDIMAITEENYYRSELHNIWTVNMDYSGLDLVVPESFANTVELLEYFDFGLLRLENYTDEQITRMCMQSAASGRLYLTDEDCWRTINNVDSELPLHASYIRYYRELTNNECYVYEFDENLFKLIRASMPRNIVEENGYIICMYNTSAAIPAEMADIAAKINTSYSNSELEKLYDRILNGEEVASNYVY